MIKKYMYVYTIILVVMSRMVADDNKSINADYLTIGDMQELAQSKQNSSEQNIYEPLVKPVTEDDYVQLGDLKNSTSTDDKTGYEDNSEPIYATIDAKDYANEIAQIIKNFSENSINNDASRLMELLEQAYTDTEGKVAEFNEAITAQITNASEKKVPLLMTFVGNVQSAKFERLFGDNNKTLLKNEFEGLKTNLLKTLFDKHEEVIAQLYVNDLKAGLINTGVQKLCETYLQNNPDEGASFKIFIQNAMKNFGQGMTTLSEKQFTHIFTIFTTSEVFKPDGDKKYTEKGPFIFVNEETPPIFKALIQAAIVNNMLASEYFKATTIQFNLKELTTELNKAGLIEKFPLLWATVSSTLLNTMTNSEFNDAKLATKRMNQLADALERSESATWVGYKINSVTRKVRNWFGSARRVADAMLSIKSRLFYRNDSLRYTKALELLNSYSEEVKTAQSINGNQLSRTLVPSVDSVFKTVAIVLQRLSGDASGGGYLETLVEKLSQLDPDRTIIETEITSKLPKKLQEQFRERLNNFSNPLKDTSIDLTFDPTKEPEIGVNPLGLDPYTAPTVKRAPAELPLVPTDLNQTQKNHEPVYSDSTLSVQEQREKEEREEEAAELHQQQNAPFKTDLVEERR